MTQEAEKTVVPVSLGELILEGISFSLNALPILHTKSPRLGSIAHQIWINYSRDQLYVLRNSEKVPGQYSNDISRLSDGTYLGKNPYKYPYLPEFTSSFEYVLVEGIICSAMARLTDKRLLELRNVLNQTGG